MSEQHVERSVALQREDPSQHLIHHHAERIDIGAPIDSLAVRASRLFRRHVRRSANDHPCSSKRHAGSVGIRPLDFGNSEIENLGNLLAVRDNQHNVVRFDVAMNQPELMCCIQSGSSLFNDRASSCDRQRARGSHEALQALPLDILHDNKRAAVFRFVKVLNLYSIYVAQLASDDGFAAEPFDETGIIRQVRRHHLQRAGFVEVHVHRFINCAHAAFADFCHDAVFAPDDRPFRPLERLRKARTILRANDKGSWIAALAIGANLHSRD